jgi:hypothetical protein
MDINSLASEFGTATPTDDHGRSEPGFDVHGLAAEFGSDKTAQDVAKLPPPDRVRPVYIIKPPISGATPEESADINAQPETQGGANPRLSEAFPLSPRVIAPNVGNAILSNASEGANNFTGGMVDALTGQPATGTGRMAIGALQGLTAIPAGVGTAVNTAATQLTGNPQFGNAAGLVASSAIPVAPSSAAYSKLRPTNTALKDLISDITNEGANPENLVPVIKGMKANPRLGPADLNPAVLSATQSLYSKEGSAPKNYLAETSSNRMASSKENVSGAFDAALGKTVNTADKLEQLKANARKVGKEQIEPVLAANPHVDVTDLIKHIDNEIGYPAMKAIKKGEAPPIPLTDYQRELLNIRGKLRNAKWPDRDQMFAYSDQLHAAQSELREKAQGLASSATGSERNTASDLFKFREKMKDAMPPEYREALSKYADEKAIEQAFRYGHDEVLAGGKSLEHDPSFFEKWVNDPKRKPAELEAAQEGARRRIDAEINGTRTAATNPAAKAIGIGQNEFSKERVTALLGKEEADKLFTSLEHARLEANTHNKIFEGSQTAQRLAANSKRELPKPTEKGLVERAVIPGVLAAAEYGSQAIGGAGGSIAAAASLGATKIGMMAKDKIKLALAKEANSQYAKMALPTEGPERDALIKSLEAALPGPKQSIVRRGIHTLSRLVQP